MRNINNGLVYGICFIVAGLFANCKTAIKEAPIILFNGTGTSPNDVEAIKNILVSNHMDFALANSAQLDALDSSQWKKYKLIIIPGGNFIKMGQGLTVSCTGNIRRAVYLGLNYLGICAGGFLAGNTGITVSILPMVCNLNFMLQRRKVSERQQ